MAAFAGRRQKRKVRMEMVTVLTFNELEEAEPLKRRLEQAGFKAEIYDERKVQRYRFISKPLAGIRVRVEIHEYERARNVLRQWDAADGALRHAIHCPECGSSRVEYPLFTRKFVLPTIYALASAVGFMERKFYCEECHYTWPTKEKLQPKTDVLGWPAKEKPQCASDKKTRAF